MSFRTERTATRIASRRRLLTLVAALFYLLTSIVVCTAPPAWSSDEDFNRDTAQPDLSESDSLENVQEIGLQQDNLAIEFASEVLPILSDHCFHCHGPDSASREADLRLDTRTGALQTTSSSKPAIDAFSAETSEVMSRLEATDPELVMPPPEESPLSASEKSVLRKWIEQGAYYDKHWAFEPVQKVRLPVLRKGDDKGWANNAIDLFVQRAWRKRRLHSLGRADAVTLIRRVTCDLVGHLPSAETVERLLQDGNEPGLARYVDALLSSPEYGQHMAASWLDAARYADTNGYQHDNQRDMWPWRDWVIQSLNEGKPFDQFTIEQLAGDLLPDATIEQRVATGFNRNHGLNFEGGSIAAESLSEYVVDRTNTLGTVWLGLTLGCAQCHDHKYDPISQQEYYGLYAFFNSVEENGFAGENGNAEPIVVLDWEAQDRLVAQLKREILACEDRLEELRAKRTSHQAEWEAKLIAGSQSMPSAPDDSVLRLDFESTAGGERVEGLKVLPGNRGIQHIPGFRGDGLWLDGSSKVDCGPVGAFEADEAFSFGCWLKTSGEHTSTVLGRALFHGYDLVWDRGKIRTNFVHRWDINAIFVETKDQLTLDQWHHVIVTYDGTMKGAGVSIYVNGILQEVLVTKDDLSGDMVSEANFFVGARNADTPNMFQGAIDEVCIFPRCLSEVEARLLAGGVDLENVVRTPAVDRSIEDARALREFYLQGHDNEFRELSEQLTKFKGRYYREDSVKLTSMVMKEADLPRPTRLLKAGRYDQPSEVVRRRTPEVLPQPVHNEAATRLDLAKWLVSPEHPLTARVFVNREWARFFAKGLVATPEDFGLRGARPTHPELLDWLAGEFVRSGWDTKWLHRTIVLSAAYQQTSKLSSEDASSSVAQDPENQWLTRFTRRRMSAEVLRDSLLKESGLLDRRVGGPSVRPFQPEGLWDDVSFQSGHTAQEYAQSKGGNAFRRSLYTFWKRSCPPPNMKLFDAPDRAVCRVSRGDTNTPLQALALLNDPCFVEPALVLANEILRQCGSLSDSEAALQSAFSSLLTREANAAELGLLQELLDRSLVEWKSDSEVRAFVKSNWPADVDLPIWEGELETKRVHEMRELAALATVLQVVLALDEALTVN
ncbi:MAG: DUF1553 domain-containing protein [Pirellulaceae bacterium]